MTHDTDTPSPAGVDIGAFCREVEAHLCRVNGGHLVRIVGPAFELVSGWAKEGMPLRIVLHGVDRTVTRLTAKGPRRRPVRIEFCEADVRDAYDQWRRAVGVRVATAETGTATSVGVRGGRRRAAFPSAVAAEAPRTRAGASVGRRRDTRADRLLPRGTGHDHPRRGCVPRCRARRARSTPGAPSSNVWRRSSCVMTRRRECCAPGHPARGTASRRSRASCRRIGARCRPPRFTMPRTALFGELVRRHFSLPQVRLDG